ncbi:MAG: 30S ribosomal protein S14 [Chlamydiia bacterium]|nr:30S ribosomal protein S14 [Chlamydiia bacterium]
MTRKCLIVKNDKIKIKVKRNYAKRVEMKKLISSPSTPPKERFALQLKLDARNKKESPTRLVNRCAVTGKKTGYISLFGVSRLVFRELAFSGSIPGLIKDSW